MGLRKAVLACLFPAAIFWIVSFVILMIQLVVDNRTLLVDGVNGDGWFISIIVVFLVLLVAHIIVGVAMHDSALGPYYRTTRRNGVWFGSIWVLAAVIYLVVLSNVAFFNCQNHNVCCGLLGVGDHCDECAERRDEFTVLYVFSWLGAAASIIMAGLALGEVGV